MSRCPPTNQNRPHQHRTVFRARGNASLRLLNAVFQGRISCARCLLSPDEPAGQT